MLKSCGRCGGIHDANYTCYKGKSNNKYTKADMFRKSYSWLKKSTNIKERDKYLCRCCISNIYNTTNIYNFNKLEAHHIVPINEDYSKRLDDDNLVTLCCYHHKLADNNIIPRKILTLLTDENCNFKEVQDLEVHNNTPPLC